MIIFHGPACPGLNLKKLTKQKHAVRIIFH